MEFVVRTPHGDADIRLDPAAPSEVTLGEVVADVTGQAIPRVVNVDDRAVEANRPVRDVVQRGSVVDTDPRHAIDDRDGVVLTTTAGPGTTRAVALEPGTYRLGPGRRVNAAELAEAPVQTAAVIINADAQHNVTVRPGDGAATPLLGGHAVDGPIPWPHHRDHDPAVGHLVVGGRSFRLDSQSSRRTRTEHQAGQSARIGLEIGVGIDTAGEPQTIDPTRGIAIAGPRELAIDALCSACLALAMTRDSNTTSIVVVTTDDNAARWEWVKWLPHARLGSTVELLVGDAAVTNWIGGRGERSSTAHATTTLLVVDAPATWRRQDGVLRTTVIDPPTDVVLVLTTPHSDDAPAATAVTLTLLDDRPGEIVDADGTVRSLLPRLLDSTVAESLARSVSAAADIPDTPPIEPPDLLDLLDVRPPAGWIVAIGRRGNAPLTIDLTDGHNLDIVAPRLALATDLATTIVLSLCFSQPPEELWVIDATGPGHTAVPGIAGIPNLVLDTVDPSHLDRRFRQRLEALLRAPMRPARVILVVADSADGTRAAEIAELAALADGHDRLTLLSIRERVNGVPKLADRALAAAAGTRLAVFERAGVRSATVIDNDSPALWFTPHTPRQTSASGVALPFVVARPFTALERRLQRRIDRAATAPPDVARAAQMLCDAVPANRMVPQLEPPTVPRSTDAATLRKHHPGDGVPIGWCDRPDLNTPDVWWWQPGRSLLIVGSERSGVQEVFGTLIGGVGERLAPDDVPIIAALANQSTRRAVARLEHCRLVADPADPLAMIGVVDALLSLDEESYEQPLVLIDDLAAVRAALEGPDAARFDNALRLVQRGGTGVVATVSTIADAGSLDDADRRAIGHLDDPDEAFRLGVPDDVGASSGQYWLLPDATIGVVATSGSAAVERDGAPDQQVGRQ
ncbi:MAG: hypothetical protein AAGF73_00745 [Actinomycetota bacterium]